MSRPRRAPRILVVDDDPGLLRLLTIRLRSQKYEVEPVDSAARALAVIAGFRPDLVITDLRMARWTASCCSASCSGAGPAST
jgi:two-component system response regulator GlrR